MTVTEPTLNWDWDAFKVDAPPPSLLDPFGELEPVAVDESLTSLLFRTPKPVAVAAPEPAVVPPPPPPPAPVESPAAERVARPAAVFSSSADLQDALFETV